MGETMLGGLPPVSVTEPSQMLITTQDRYMDMDDHTFKKGDLGDPLQATLKDGDGNVIDLSNASQVNLRLETPDETQQLDAQMTVVNASNGEVEYNWQSGDPIETADVYYAEAVIDPGTSSQQTVPNDGKTPIEVED